MLGFSKIKLYSLVGFILAIISFPGFEKCKISPLEYDGPGLDLGVNLKGYPSSDFGQSYFSPCVEDLIEKIADIPYEKGSSKVHKVKNGELGISMNLFKHPQGVVRIPSNENWLILTRNHATNAQKAGVVSLKFPNGHHNIHTLSDSHSVLSLGEIRDFYTTEDNKHPGGCQLIGQYLAVAHEAVVDSIVVPTWISFYDVSDPENIYEANRFCFNGIDGVGHPYFLTDKGQAICVGITKLENGHYLMFALESRRRLPSDVGWFFMSTSKDLPNTDWNFVQFWHQDYLLPDKNSFRTYENINLLSDCNSGDIYMLGFFGKGRNNAVDLFKLEIDQNQKIILTKVFEKKIRTQNKGATFRAGASIHVTPDNDLILYSVEKSDTDKWISIEEFSSLVSEEKNAASTQSTEDARDD